jgi:hypothetical protein
MKWWQQGRILVVTDWLRLKMIGSLYFKVDINFVPGSGSWLGGYNEYGDYLSRKCNDMVATRPELGCYIFGLVEATSR